MTSTPINLRHHPVLAAAGRERRLDRLALPAAALAFAEAGGSAARLALPTLPLPGQPASHGGSGEERRPRAASGFSTGQATTPAGNLPEAAGWPPLAHGEASGSRIDPPPAGSLPGRAWPAAARRPEICEFFLVPNSHCAAPSGCRNPRNAGFSASEFLPLRELIRESLEVTSWPCAGN